MKKQARDIAKTSNGKVVLVAADELKVTSSFYGSIFAEKKNVTFYLDVDQAEYLYEFAKSFGDCSYSSCKKNEAQKLKRILLVRRQSFYNNQPKKYPWYLEIEVTKNEKKEKSCINMTDEGFFTFMNRIHRFIDCFVTAYSTNIMKMKFNNEQNWKQNKN